MIAIVKYNAGNVKSVQNALDGLGHSSVITDDPAELKEAKRVIFPGVGEASSAMTYLQERGLDKLIKELKQPVLGICLGQQLMCAYSEEGDAECLGIFDALVRKFPPKDIVPHMGWNNLINPKGALFKNVPDSADFYFVHSFFCEMSKETIAECDYILPFSAAMQKDNFYATQFHPEKSAEVGSIVLKNFLAL